jgi:hypothetical protein
VIDRNRLLEIESRLRNLASRKSILVADASMLLADANYLTDVRMALDKGAMLLPMPDGSRTDSPQSSAVVAPEQGATGANPLPPAQRDVPGASTLPRVKGESRAVLICGSCRQAVEDSWTYCPACGAQHRATAWQAGATLPLAVVEECLNAIRPLRKNYDPGGWGAAALDQAERAIRSLSSGKK